MYWLTAYDEASPYLIAGENQSYFGEGTASYSNIFRYQRTYDQGSNLGLITTNRIFKNGGYGGLWRVFFFNSQRVAAAIPWLLYYLSPYICYIILLLL